MPDLFTRPDTLSISPRNAEMMELLPAPTVPTMAINEFLLAFKLILCKTGSSLPHEKVPFSIDNDESGIGKNRHRNVFFRELTVSVRNEYGKSMGDLPLFDSCCTFSGSNSSPFINLLIRVTETFV